MKYATQVGVIGPSEATMEQQEQAERVGALIAERGGIVVCGGYGGVMEAACKGAKSKGGKTIGILSGTDKNERNPYVEGAVATGMGQARNAAVVHSSDVIIAVGGGYGTLTELAMALKSKIPVIGLNTWEAESPRSPWTILVAQSPEQAVDLAFQQLEKPSVSESHEELSDRSPILDVH